MLQINFDKAFDRVKHDVLFDVLERANMGSIILEGAKMVCKNCTTILIVNKELTEAISLRSPVRQGCALSPSSFSLNLEPFFFERAEVRILSRFYFGQCSNESHELRRRRCSILSG